MVKFSSTAVTTWLVSAVLVGVSSAASNGGSKVPLFGLFSKNGKGTEQQQQQASASMPLMVNPGGASEAIGNTDDEHMILEKDGRDAPLFRDIEILTDILLDIVKDEDENIHQLYFEFLKYGQERYV
jgi:hypothetical protein